MNKTEFLARNPGWNPNSWYIPEAVKAMNALGKLTDSDIGARVDSYFEWFKAKHGKDYDPAMHKVEGETAKRETIIKAAKIIGYVAGKPVTVRPITAGTGVAEPVRDSAGEVLYTKAKRTAPALFIVGHNGRRIDSFLKLENAKKCAARFIENGGENV